MNKFVSYLLSAFIVSFMWSSQSYAYKRVLHASGRYLRDQDNRVILLRGFSVSGSSKLPPFETINPGDLDHLVPMGANVIRLLFNWEAFEPARGQYNLNYLAYYDGVIHQAAERGIYVVVDMHQDAYSRYSLGGCGEGFPRWSIPDEIVKVHRPNNGKKCALWGLQIVFDADLHKTWKLFYQDHAGVRTRFLQLWSYLAQHFSTNENVIGYDILNEPWGDEKTEIGPLFEDAARVIREQDPDSVLFLTPQVLHSTGTRTNLPRPSFQNFVYSAHYYNATIEVLHAWFHMSPRKALRKLQAKADEWGVPLFLGEFGEPDGVVGATDYVRALYRCLDQAFTGGAQWVYSPGWNKSTLDGWNDEDLSVVDGAGNLRRNFEIHPYPEAIAGEPIEGGFRVDTGKTDREARTGRRKSLSFQWQVGPEMVGKTTKVFAPRAELGGIVLTSNQLRCDYDAAEVNLTCIAGKPGLQEVLIK